MLQLNTETGQLYDDGTDNYNYDYDYGPIGNIYTPPTVTGTPYDDNGNLNPGWQLNENNDPVWVGTSSTPSIPTNTGGGGGSTTSTTTPPATTNPLTSWINKTLGTKLTDKEVAALGIGAGGIAGLLGANTAQRNPVGFQGTVPTLAAVRQQVPQPTTPRAYGAPAMGRRYFTDTQYVAPAGLAAAQTAATQQAQNIAAAQQPKETTQAAHGGLMAAAKGRYLQGDTDGMADEVRTSIDGKQPAALSHGEFVVPADVVSHLGNGNSDAGAKKLYQMMDKVRQARTGTKKQGKEINPDKFMPGGLAATKEYAGGGDVTGTAINAGLTGTESNLSNWAGPYVTNMLGQGAALANQPYQAYTGQLTAGASPLQEKVFGGLQNINFPGTLGQSFTAAGAPTPGTPTAGGITGGTPGQGIASQYMNPYLQNVLQPQLEELRRQSQINLQPSLAKLTQAGGLGGGRQAIMESEAARNLLTEQNKTVGQGYASAFDKAREQFNIEQGQGKTLADMMAQAGTAQRGLESEALGAEKAQFEEERANPYKMVQFQQSLLQGLPLAAQNYNVAQPSILQQVAGGTSGLATLLANLGYTIPGATPTK